VARRRRTRATFQVETSEKSNGDYGLYRWDVDDQQAQAPPHFHRGISEAFFVLSGISTFYSGEDWKESGEGDFLFLPKGGVHGFRNDHGPASMLILFTPGAPCRAYFALLAERAARPVHPAAASPLSLRVGRVGGLWC